MMRESNAWAAKQGVNSENYQHCYHANLSQLHSLSRDFKMQLKAGGGYFILHKMWQRKNFPSETRCFSRNLQELPSVTQLSDASKQPQTAFKAI